MTLTAPLQTFDYNPRGHRRSASRRNYERPSDVLIKAFEEWMAAVTLDPSWGDAEKSFNRARYRLKHEEVTVRQVHELVDTFSDFEHICNAGGFLSAACHSTNENVIVWDFDIPIHRFGYKLPKDKILLNLGNAGFSLGMHASGPVINSGEAGICMGWYASSYAVNFGKTDDAMGCDADGAIFNFGETLHQLGINTRNVVVNVGSTHKCLGNGAKGTVVNLGSVVGSIADGCKGVAIDKTRGAVVDRCKSFFLDDPRAQPLKDYFASLTSQVAALREADHEVLPSLIKHLPNAETIKRDIAEIVRDLQ